VRSCRPAATVISNVVGAASSDKAEHKRTAGHG
jgi:hypothetical protein